MQGSPAEIVPVAWRDLGPVAEIQRRSFRRGLAYKWWMLATFHAWPGVTFLVAKSKDRIAGCIIADTHRGKTRIMNIAVHPDFRQQGIGMRLMRSVMVIAPDRDVQLMVQEENRAARAMYEQLGFRRSGFHGSYYGPGNAGIEMTLRR